MDRHRWDLLGLSLSVPSHCHCRTATARRRCSTERSLVPWAVLTLCPWKWRTITSKSWKNNIVRAQDGVGVSFRITVSSTLLLLPVHRRVSSRSSPFAVESRTDPLCLANTQTRRLLSRKVRWGLRNASALCVLFLLFSPRGRLSLMRVFYLRVL